MISLGPADPCLHSLLGLLIDPGGARTMSLAQWDKTIRLARQARLLGVLAHRIQSRAGLLADVPECVLGHLYSATAYSAHRSQLLRIELTALADVLPAELPVVLLKGAAYLVQDLEVARGRLPGDVDLMVARNDLDRAEAALLGAGWEAEEIDAYGERYYREWSHEL
ncbi:MAG: nucleotidyltransferase family protein, partial [Candidatus Accumulibacter sp.]|nr:nucleotidyltransferase family protein [Accumulibacter sp.]